MTTDPLRAEIFPNANALQVRCVYYVGNKDERARKYQAEVQPLQFNVLVTTYEFIMRDRAKLSKVGLLCL